MCYSDVMPNRTSHYFRLRWKVLARDHFTCQYCGQSAPSVTLHVDHKKPVVDGGPDEARNLVTACMACNLGKGSDALHMGMAVSRHAGPTLAELLEMYFLKHGPSTATRLAKKLTRARASIALNLSRNPRFEVKKRLGSEVYYGLAPNDEFEAPTDG